MDWKRSGHTTVILGYMDGRRVASIDEADLSYWLDDGEGWRPKMEAMKTLEEVKAWILTTARMS